MSDASHGGRSAGGSGNRSKITPTTPKEEELMVSAMTKSEQQDVSRTFVLRLQVCRSYTYLDHR